MEQTLAPAICGFILGFFTLAIIIAIHDIK